MFFMQRGAPGPENAEERIRADLVEWALNNAESSLREVPLSEGAPPPDLAMLRTLFTHFAFFYIHWIDRLALAELGGGRDAFIDALHEQFIPRLGEKHYAKMPDQLRTELEGQLSEQLNGFVLDVAQYQVVPSPSVPMRDSLAWMFSTGVAAELGRPRDPFVIAQVSAILASRLADDKVRSLVHSVAAAQDVASKKPSQTNPAAATRGEQAAEELYQRMQGWAPGSNVDEIPRKDDEAREWWERNKGRVLLAALAGVVVLSGMCTTN